MTTEEGAERQDNGAEEVFAITDGSDVLAEDELEWAGISVEIEVDFTPEEGVSLASVMRMRGAVASASQMMKGGMADLARGANLDGHLEFAFGLFTMGGELLLDAVGVSLNDHLEAAGAPVCSLYPVESSNIAAMGWVGDPGSTPVAVVEFTNGSLYEYQGVGNALFSEWWDAPSKGRFLAAEIKDNFEFRRLA